MSSFRWLKILLLLILLTLIASLAIAQAVSPMQAGQSPDRLSCTPAPCVLPIVQVGNFTYGAVPAALTANPNHSNELVLSAGDANCGSYAGFYSTRDGGLTWPGHSCTSDGGMVGYDLNNRVFSGGIEFETGIRVRYSDNNGLLWSRSKLEERSLADSAQLVVDTSPSSPLRNSIYISSLQEEGLDGSNVKRVFVSHSNKGGKAWEGVPLDDWQIPNYDAPPWFSAGEDGRLYVTWLRCTPVTPNGFCIKDAVPIYLSKSGDGGMTWTPPSVIASANLTPGNCTFGCVPNLGGPLNNVPVNAVVGSGPTARVYVAFYNWTGTQMQVEVVTSTDGGKTFGAPVPVSVSNVGDQLVPSIAAARDGTIAVSWLDRRNDPANIKYQPFIAASKDGQVFGPSFPLTSYLTDPAPFQGQIPGTAQPLWIGSTVYLTWTDDSSGVWRPELGGVQF